MGVGGTTPASPASRATLACLALTLAASFHSADGLEQHDGRHLDANDEGIRLPRSAVRFDGVSGSGGGGVNAHLRVPPRRWCGREEEEEEEDARGTSGCRRPGSTSGVMAEAWVRVKTHKTHNWVVGTDRRDRGWALFVDGGERACFGLFRDKALRTISSRALTTPHGWHHVVGVYDPHDPAGTPSLVVYVDGDPGDRVPLTGTTPTSFRPWGPASGEDEGDGDVDDADVNDGGGEAHSAWPLGFTIGGAPDWPSLRMDGEIDGVRVWAGAADHAWVLTAMLSSHGDVLGTTRGGRPRLVGSWRLDEAEGTTFEDDGPDNRPGAFQFADAATGRPGEREDGTHPRGGGLEWIPSSAPAFLTAPESGGEATLRVLRLGSGRGGTSRAGTSRAPARAVTVLTPPALGALWVCDGDGVDAVRAEERAEWDRIRARLRSNVDPEGFVVEGDGVGGGDAAERAGSASSRWSSRLFSGGGWRGFLGGGSAASEEEETRGASATVSSASAGSAAKHCRPAVPGEVMSPDDHRPEDAWLVYRPPAPSPGDGGGPSERAGGDGDELRSVDGVVCARFALEVTSAGGAVRGGDVNVTSAFFVEVTSWADGPEGVAAAALDRAVGGGASGSKEAPRALRFHGACKRWRHQAGAAVPRRRRQSLSTATPPPAPLSSPVVVASVLVPLTRASLAPTRAGGERGSLSTAWGAAVAAVLAQSDPRWELIVAYEWTAPEARRTAEEIRSRFGPGVAGGGTGVEAARLRFVPVGVGRKGEDEPVRADGPTSEPAPGGLGRGESAGFGSGVGCPSGRVVACALDAAADLARGSWLLPMTCPSWVLDREFLTQGLEAVSAAIEDDVWAVVPASLLGDGGEEEDQTYTLPTPPRCLSLEASPEEDCKPGGHAHAHPSSSHIKASPEAVGAWAAAALGGVGGDGHQTDLSAALIPAPALVHWRVYAQGGGFAPHELTRDTDALLPRSGVDPATWVVGETPLPADTAASSPEAHLSWWMWARVFARMNARGGSRDGNTSPAEHYRPRVLRAGTVTRRPEALGGTDARWTAEELDEALRTVRLEVWGE